jgi:hypothetical protein
MGIVLYECLTGRVPYDAEGLIELCMQIAAGRAVPPSQLAEVPSELERVVLSAMHANESQRFASMDELITALERVRPSLDARAQAAVPAQSYATATWTPDPAPISGTVPRTAPIADGSPTARTDERKGVPRVALFAVVGVVGVLAFVIGAAGLMWALPRNERAQPIARAAVEPIERRPAPHAAPAPPPIPAPETAPPPAPPAPVPPSYAEIAANLEAHRGAAVAFEGIVSQRESETAFLLFVVAPSCAGANACALRASGELTAPSEGQAVRIHGEVSGPASYRTRAGIERPAPHVRVDRLELLASLNTPAIDDAERPEVIRRARPVREQPVLAPRQLAPAVPSRPARPTVSANEI